MVRDHPAAVGLVNIGGSARIETACWLSVASNGDSSDPFAATANGLYRTELIKRWKCWHSPEELELAKAEWARRVEQAPASTAQGDYTITP